MSESPYFSAYKNTGHISVTSVQHLLPNDIGGSFSFN